MHPFYCFLIALVIPLTSFAERSAHDMPGIPGHANGNDSMQWHVDFRQTVSKGNNTPFWLVNNLQGLGSPEKGYGHLRASVFKDFNRSRGFSWEAGIDIAGSWHSEAPFRLHQIYAGIKYRCLSAFAGSKELWDGGMNPLLSSGGLLYSGNSFPIPQIRAGIPEYAEVWGCRRRFAVKGYVAYGVFSDQRWQKSWTAPQYKRTEGVLYHSKGLWMRFGNPNGFPLTGEFGIEMASQFGGRSIKDGKVIEMASGIKAWWQAFFPTWVDQDTSGGSTHTIDGNMLGTYTFSLSWKSKKGWNLKAYYQHLWEDHSQMFFEYGWKDGLWGIEATLPRNPAVGTVVFEYLDTRDQTGAVLHNETGKLPEQISGRDDYYANFIYQGWNHWGMTIGNPLLLSPVYNPDHLLSTRTNRVQAWHLGISGQPLPALSYRVLLSCSRNWGTYQWPLPEVENNFNFMAEAVWRPSRLKGWTGALSVAGDGGKLLGRSAGVALTVSKTGCFSFGKKKSTSHKDCKSR